MAVKAPMQKYLSAGLGALTSQVTGEVVNEYDIKSVKAGLASGGKKGALQALTLRITGKFTSAITFGGITATDIANYKESKSLKDVIKKKNFLVPAIIIEAIALPQISLPLTALYRITPEINIENISNVRERMRGLNIFRRRPTPEPEPELPASIEPPISPTNTSAAEKLYSQLLKQDRTAKLAKQKTGLAPADAPRIQPPASSPLQPGLAEPTPTLAPPIPLDQSTDSQLANTLIQARSQKKKKQTERNQQSAEPDLDQEQEDLPDRVEPQEPLEDQDFGEPTPMGSPQTPSQKKSQEKIKEIIIRWIVGASCSSCSSCCLFSAPLWLIILLGTAIALGVIAFSGELFEWLGSLF
ncbi:hypothetical protein COT97_00630 [Candidatus Falkowbacteria bacterium CG10_big_fil_rev_8_21_14_0_10_39_11]|uniref:Uncharacterized protein n=1 Tax=Candidatus Falkowbacteria bacterium CG10_big_fil_rev_8_21_14_0_10_39_11 TaxID=1974565 RepID=A0A2H0V605_9BACT|nr:MAG: hypothetical protein COT97_00630 [Candidatus Falkowbacteria bacterium CG10_big_fil_rev_8_21_14_0_10_39_11]